MKLFFFAGEKSGDLHGSHVIKALKDSDPTIKMTGVAGPKMRMQGCSGVLRMEDFEVMGFTDVLKSLPKLWKQFHLVKSHILDEKPDGVVLIDYPGFNLRLAKALRKEGYQGKLVQYVAPSVWAHGKERIQQMEQTLDLLLTIYPFEKAYFKESSLKVEYVGNPIGEYVSEYVYRPEWKQELGIPAQKKLVAIFPGSRRHEVERNLKFQLAAVKKLKKNYPDLCIAVSSMHSNLVDSDGGLYLVPPDYTYELMRDSCCALAKSGTVTLELALHQCPTVVSYHVSGLNRLYGKYVLKLNLPLYCIVNILGGQEVFPEFIEKKISPEGLNAKLLDLYQPGSAREACLAECKKIQNKLFAYKPSCNAAFSIRELFSS